MTRPRQRHYTPVKQPTDGYRLHLDNWAYNALLRAQRASGERGFALLKGRWKAFRFASTVFHPPGDLPDRTVLSFYWVLRQPSEEVLPLLVSGASQHT